MDIPLGYDPGYRDYVKVFDDCGKGLNSTDLNRGHAVWMGLDQSARSCAMEHAQRVFPATETRYIPFPVNHLLGRPWERQDKPRVIPLVKRKAGIMDELRAEIEAEEKQA